MSLPFKYLFIFFCVSESLVGFSIHVWFVASLFFVVINAVMTYFIFIKIILTYVRMRVAELFLTGDYVLYQMHAELLDELFKNGSSI